MLRAAILHNEYEWTPENYEPEERIALEEALQIQREAEIIQLTGWTFDQFDAQPAHRVARMMHYVGLKSTIEKIKSDMDSGSTGSGGPLTGGRN